MRKAGLLLLAPLPFLLPAPPPPSPPSRSAAAWWRRKRRTCCSKSSEHTRRYSSPSQPPLGCSSSLEPREGEELCSGPGGEEAKAPRPQERECGLATCRSSWVFTLGAGMRGKGNKMCWSCLPLAQACRKETYGLPSVREAITCNDGAHAVPCGAMLLVSAQPREAASSLPPFPPRT